MGLQQDQEGLPGDENEFEAEGADGPVVAEVQEGKVRGSINYVINGKLYRKDTFYKGNIHTSCINKHKGCRGRATICKDSLEVIKLSGQHSCGIESIQAAIVRWRTR